jgi:hypothetical protein
LKRGGGKESDYSSTLVRLLGSTTVAATAATQLTLQATVTGLGDVAGARAVASSFQSAAVSGDLDSQLRKFKGVLAKVHVAALVIEVT